MGAQIIPLVTPASVDCAWAAYVEFAARAVNNPEMLLDRDFFNEMARREARYKQLFLAAERVG